MMRRSTCVGMFVAFVSAVIAIVVLLLGRNMAKNCNYLNKESEDMSFETIAGHQINNEEIKEPEATYSITELDSFFFGRTLQNNTDPSLALISLSEAETAFPTPYIRFFSKEDRELCYLAYPIQEGGTYIVPFILPAGPNSSDPSQFLARSSFWTHDLPTKNEFEKMIAAVETSRDLSNIRAPIFQGLFSSTNTVLYCLLDEKECAVITLEMSVLSDDSDVLVKSVESEYVSIDDSPFSWFLSSDLADTSWE